MRPRFRVSSFSDRMPIGSVLIGPALVGTVFNGAALNIAVLMGVVLVGTSRQAAAQSGPYSSATTPPAALASPAVHAPAQNAPLISSGRSPTDSAGAAATQVTSASGAQTPAGPSSSLRDEPARGDQSWTRSASLGSNSAPNNLQTSSAQTAVSQSNQSPGSGAPAVISPASAIALPDSGGLRPVRGQSEPGSFVAQAQYSESQYTSVDPAPTAQSGQTERRSSQPVKDPRPLKPPTNEDAAIKEKRSTGTVQMFVSVASSLMIVFGLLFGAAWCYRKASPNVSGNLPKQVVQILGRTPLAPRQQLVVVRFGQKLVLVSNLQGEVRTISEITDPLEVDRMAGLCESSQVGSISDSFRTVLHSIGRTG